jgi:hypothetical protein
LGGASKRGEMSEASASAIAAAATKATHRCRNCGFDLLSVPSAKYCPECGQETDSSPPTFREFVRHFFGNYIAVKGSLVQTIWRLISRPGVLTRDYLDGRKRAYMLPLRLYLTVSVVCFLIFGLLVNLGATQADSAIKTEDFKDAAVLNFGDSSYVKFENNTATCKNVPDWLCERAKKKFATPEARKALVISLPDRMLRY